MTAPLTSRDRILAVTGLAVEARIASGDDIVTVCGGGDVQRLRGLLAAVDPRALRAVVSFGLAGGLDPALRTGDVVVAANVASGQNAWATSLSHTSALASRLSGRQITRTIAQMAGADAIVLAPVNKTELHATGAAAVDMESHAAAEFAETHGLPFVVVRVICDSASRKLPALARDAMGPQGRIDMPVVLRSLVRNPAQIPALMQTGRDYAVAIAALRRCRLLLGLGLGLGLADAGELVLDVT
jgi:adenosylhomocysteine nucleosidase